MLEPELPPRAIHLVGGLLAQDTRNGHVSLCFRNGTGLLGFAAAEYAQVYQQLLSLGFKIVGVEFINEPRLEGRYVPDWQSWNPSGGFTAMEEERAWGSIRTAAISDQNGLVKSVASRFKTYIQLLQLRLFDYSRCYEDTLNAWRLNGSRTDLLYSDGFLTRIDAATHAFMADAASFRDLLVEAIWLLVLKNEPGVAQISAFLKATKGSQNALAQSIQNFSRPNNWLGKFSQIRNNITHVAPVGRGQTFHNYEVRERKISDKHLVPSVHYPLLTGDGDLYEGSLDPLNYNDEENIKSALKTYRDYCSSSLDGLTYVQATLHELLAISSAIRSAAELRSEMLHITDDDIIGPVEFI